MRRRILDGPVRDRMEELAIQHPDWGPAQVHRMLLEQFGEPRAPILRTVQRFLRDFNRPIDGDGPWSAADAEPEEVPLVLGVARELMELEHDAFTRWPRWPTRAVAAWIVKIRVGYPDLEDLTLVWYMAAVATRGQPYLGRVEKFLAFTPWRDGGDAYFQAVQRGMVDADAIQWVGWERWGDWHWREEQEQREQGQGGTMKGGSE